MTDQEKDELNKVLDEKKITLTLEKFGALQSPSKPKYAPKAQAHTNSFISGSGLDD